MKKIRVSLFGAGGEVGRSCVRLRYPDHSCVVLDYGLKPEFRDGSWAYVLPAGIRKPPEIGLVALSHGHADHIGGVPRLVKDGLRCPIVCSPTTWDVSGLMLFDALSVNRNKGIDPGYDEGDIENSLSLMKTDLFGVSGSVKYQLLHAGHIPGSVCTFLEYEGRSVLYTGDVNDIDTRLVRGCEKLPHSEVLIVDATYGDRIHPPREETENRFRKMVLETIRNGGSVFIAAFALARTQEILLLLHEMGLDVPIHLDGLGQDITDIFLAHPEALKDPEALEKLNYSLRRISRWDRDTHLMTQGVFVATSGMLEGGPILEYIRQKGNDPRNLLVLTGYQAENTRGRRLIETGKIYHKNEFLELACRVEQLSFSSHADRDSIRRIIQMVRPTNVIAQHGSPRACQAVVKMARELGCLAYAPKTGESIDV